MHIVAMRNNKDDHNKDDILALEHRVVPYVRGGAVGLYPTLTPTLQILYLPIGPLFPSLCGGGGIPPYPYRNLNGQPWNTQAYKDNLYE